MSRNFKILILAIAALLILSCLGGLFPLDILAALIAGWAFYLARVLPQIRFNWSGAATGVVCLTGFSAGLHVLLTWFYSQWAGQQQIQVAGAGVDLGSVPPPRWERRWTAAIVILTLLCFVTGMAATGIAHQVGWLVTEPGPFLSESGSARAAARRFQSMNNLKEIARAVINIETRDKALPPGCTVDSNGEVLHGWMTFLLPFIEQQKVFDEIDLKLPWDDPHNLAVFQRDVLEFQNPGSAEKELPHDQNGLALTNYSGNIHVLGGARRLTLAEITDGTSNTILAGEIAERFPPWGKPGNWRDPGKGLNRSPSGFGSPWRRQNAGAGASILFLDGSVRFIKDSVDPKIMEALGTPHGQERVENDAY
jgi:hypothetical protein